MSTVVDMSGFRINVPNIWPQQQAAAPGAMGSGMHYTGVPDPTINMGTLGTGMSQTNLSGFGVPQNNGMGIGMNIPTFQLGLGAVNSLGNLWQSWNASKLAKQQLNMVRDVTNTNLNNSIKEYNTALADRAHNRAAMAGQPAASAQDYINQHSLSR